jgi:hypothetical protein
MISSPSLQELKSLKQVEVWRQDESDPDLWHHANGLMINSAALVEREAYYIVVRIRLGE